MTNYMAVISYDGTNYKGWQLQNNTDETIQGKLKKILSELSVDDVDVIGSGRTDAGVHALGQVANFHINVPENMSDKDILLFINSHLPRDIAVISLTKVANDFHARYKEKGKTYRYRIHVSPISNVFEKRFIYTYLDYPLDVNLMKNAAKLLEGEHDFMAFCANKHMKKSTVRTIYKIDINEISDENGLKEISIDYSGNGFLQNMIRIMTGTLIEIGSKRRPVEDITKIIDSRNRENAGYTAPPQGLCLMKVDY